MRAACLVMILLLSAAFASTAEPPDSSRPAGDGSIPLVLDGLNVLDTTGTSWRAGTSVVIREGRIQDVYATGSRRAPNGARVLDLRGRYAIPGLIDAHVHLTAPFVRSGEQDSLARFYLLGGITAIRDMAGDGIVLRERARAARAGSALSPRIYYSTIVASPGFFTRDRRAAAVAHGGTPGELAWARAVTSDSGAVAAAAGAREIGATGIKVYAELPPALLRAVAHEAHARGLKVWSHATVTPSKPSDAVAAGVDVLSHVSMCEWESHDSLPDTYSTLLDSSRYGTPADAPALVRLFSEMHRRGTMLDATLYVSRRLARGRRVLEGDLSHMRGVDRWANEAARLAYRSGVRFVAGTDVSGYPGLNLLSTLHEELAMYVNVVGMTAAEALATATSNAAEMLGAQDDMGTIARGRFADLLILDADPLANIRNTRRIAYVVKGGVFHVGDASTALEASDTLDWRPSWPGTRMAVLEGDPSNKGRFVFRFWMPGGYWIHPHRHPVDAHIRVISGTFRVGMGERLDSTTTRDVPAGSEITLEAEMSHFEGARGPTVVEISGEGPWGVTFLDPERDPGRPSATR